MICSICLDNVKFYHKRKQLSCCHIFHLKCILKVIELHKPECPNCGRYICTKNEKEILAFKIDVDDENISSEFFKEVFTFGNNTKLENIILKKISNLSLLLIEFIENKNVNLVDKIIKSNKINLYETFSGLTYLDYAFKSKNDEIANIIIEKIGYDPTPSAPPY